MALDALLSLSRPQAPLWLEHGASGVLGLLHRALCFLLVAEETQWRLGTSQLLFCYAAYCYKKNVDIQMISFLSFLTTQDGFTESAS